MQRRKYLKAIAGSAATISIAGCSSGGEDEYPSDTITIVVPFGSGGGTDSAFRTVQDPIAQQLPEESEFVVDNRPGATGRLGTQDVYDADSDGYTVLATPTEPVIGQFFFDVNYDVYEMTPISYMLDNIYSLVASPDRFGNDFESFVEDARAEDKVTLGSVGIGGSNNFAGVAALDALDIDFSHVPYDSGSQVASAAASGDVDIGVAAHTGVTGLMEEDRLQMHLLLHDEQLYEGIPVPSTVEYDIPIVTFAMGMYAPPDMDEERASALEDLIVSGLESDASTEAASNAGLVLQAGGADALEDLITQIESDIESYQLILDDQGIDY
ncbi:Bug family tripartite tricarboxylate transporter substrate binding protein [Halorarum salinum]|uniref:Tripartite tricarboxylate transporter substrate binding protein n=1 Tax=Halorarum salinum TaxID=2743089 RepID=A0A7D5QI26_9EURY|nr:tripartite tricarboxylate transporter substrate binding protein [Halobaculum salinum]QLG60305.1 tripartite tricarboxylate transporter substrate binding protein [Halobaculum salinum]